MVNPLLALFVDEQIVVFAICYLLHSFKFPLGTFIARTLVFSKELFVLIDDVVKSPCRTLQIITDRYQEFTHPYSPTSLNSCASPLRNSETSNTRRSW